MPTVRAILSSETQSNIGAINILILNWLCMQKRVWRWWRRCVSSTQYTDICVILETAMGDGYFMLWMLLLLLLLPHIHLYIARTEKERERARGGCTLNGNLAKRTFVNKPSKSQLFSTICLFLNRIRKQNKMHETSNNISMGISIRLFASHLMRKSNSNWCTTLDKGKIIENPFIRYGVGFTPPVCSEQCWSTAAFIATILFFKRFSTPRWYSKSETFWEFPLAFLSIALLTMTSYKIYNIYW